MLRLDEYNLFGPLQLFIADASSLFFYPSLDDVHHRIYAQGRKSLYLSAAGSDTPENYLVNMAPSLLYFTMYTVRAEGLLGPYTFFIRCFFSCAFCKTPNGSIENMNIKISK